MASPWITREDNADERVEAMDRKAFGCGRERELMPGSSLGPVSDRLPASSGSEPAVPGFLQVEGLGPDEAAHGGAGQMDRTAVAIAVDREPRATVEPAAPVRGSPDEVGEPAQVGGLVLVGKVVKLWEGVCVAARRAGVPGAPARRVAGGAGRPARAGRGGARPRPRAHRRVGDEGARRRAGAEPRRSGRAGDGDYQISHSESST